jgi:hypothetical protein
MAFASQRFDPAALYLPCARVPSPGDTVGGHDLVIGRKVFAANDLRQLLHVGQRFLCRAIEHKTV